MVRAVPLAGSIEGKLANHFYKIKLFAESRCPVAIFLPGSSRTRDGTRLGLGRGGRASLGLPDCPGPDGDGGGAAGPVRRGCPREDAVARLKEAGADQGGEPRWAVPGVPGFRGSRGGRRSSRSDPGARRSRYREPWGHRAQWFRSLWRPRREGASGHGGEDPVVEPEIEARTRDQGGELFEQLRHGPK